jgi:hypothetical protein
MPSGDGDGNRTGLMINFGGTLSDTSVVGGINDPVISFSYDATNRLYAVSQGTASQGSALKCRHFYPRITTGWLGANRRR